MRGEARARKSATRWDGCGASLKAHKSISTSRYSLMRALSNADGLGSLPCLPQIASHHGNIMASKMRLIFFFSADACRHLIIAPV
jgi:hypothetical protein